MLCTCTALCCAVPHCERRVLPVRAEAATRSTATVLETPIAPRMTAVKGTTGQSALGEEKEMISHTVMRRIEETLNMK